MMKSKHTGSIQVLRALHINRPHRLVRYTELRNGSSVRIGKTSRAYIFILLAAILLLPTGEARAVDGVNMIGVGPISRSMGGVGIVSPQDTVTALYANPAGMSFAPFGSGVQVDFDASLINPRATSTIDNGVLGTNKDVTRGQVLLSPAIGLTMPINDKFRFAVGILGTSGLADDYRGTDLDKNITGSAYPLMATAKAQYAVMKLIPAVSYKVTDNFSVGLALSADYATLDMGAGTSSDYGFGAQAGFSYKLTGDLTAGVTYVNSQLFHFKRVSDVNGDGTRDNLKIELPQEVGFGLSYTALLKRLLLETNVKWINWSNAEGWKDFDWEDQWVFAFGAQYAVTPKLSLRCGYNYASSPVKKHDGFNGAAGNTTNVQGKEIPTYYYEGIRSIAVQAFTDHRITFGVGYQLSPNVAINVGYVREFGNTFRESGTGFAGPMSYETELTANTYEMGLTLRF